MPLGQHETIGRAHGNLPLLPFPPFYLYPLLLLCFLYLTTMNNGNTNNYKLTPNPRNYALSAKIMLCTVIILFLAVFIILGFHTYSRRFFNRRRRLRRSSSVSAPPPLPHHHDDCVGIGGGGLDLSILKSLPTFTFSNNSRQINKHLECAVCLSEFQEGETGRCLPKCNHCFHLECIDAWFCSHANCPLCRGWVDGNKCGDVVVIAVEEEEEEDGEMGSSCSSVSGSSSLTSCSSCSCLEKMEERWKELEKMGLSLTEGKRPGGDTVLSLKRIWSV